MRSQRPVRTAFVVALAIGAAVPALAQREGEKIEGTLRKIDLHGSPRHIVVQHGGGNVTQQISSATRLVFSPSEAGYFEDGELSDLKPGMVVHFRWSSAKLERLHIDSVPDHLRPGRGGRRDDDEEDDDGGGETRELKVRLESIDERRGEFRADVAGRKETFRLDNPRDIRRFSTGDLVIITVERRRGGEVVTDVESAGYSGRVVRVWERGKQIFIEVDGDEQQYYVDDKDLLDNVDVGDRVRFEFEDRSGGRKVITAIY